MSFLSSLKNLSLDERKIIVGVDFGTTFSGLAWAEKRRNDQINMIDTWPSSLTELEGTSDAKVPTQLRYTKANMEWGFQIPPLVERHEWFKLCLTGASPRKAVPAGPSRTPEELTGDYLSALIKHLRYILGQKLGAAVLRSVSLEFVLTVPTLWSESTKEKTLAACRKAGLDTKTSVSLVSEPEAAAIYTLKNLNPHGLEVGDTFVLCDAGGGTVDLISYSITGLFPELQVKEASPGTGGFCGSTYLDESFSNYLTRKLSNEPGWDSDVLADAMSQFNTIKRQYSTTSSSADGYSISLPGLSNNPRLGIRRGKMKIMPSQMQAIFDPVINQVIALVKGQISSTKRNVKAVLLVGGFGQNIYLKERLRSCLSSLIEVRQPANAWTAVVRGAVMMGAHSNAVKLLSRVARKHYGVILADRYDRSIHSRSERFWHQRRQEYCVNAMKWFVKKGEAVKVGVPVSISFYQHFKVSDGYPQTASMKVYCDSVTPTAPIHENSNVNSFAELEADLSQIPRSEIRQLIKKSPDGNVYYVFDGAVEATFNSASMKYVYVIRGVRYDIVTVDYS